VAKSNMYASATGKSIARRGEMRCPDGQNATFRLWLLQYQPHLPITSALASLRWPGQRVVPCLVINTARHPIPLPISPVTAPSNVSLHLTEHSSFHSLSPYHASINRGYHRASDPCFHWSSLRTPCLELLLQATTTSEHRGLVNGTA
jgi:hypothetical protein